MSNTVITQADLTVYEGGTLDIQFQWKIDDIVVSLLNKTALMIVRKKITDSDPPLLTIPYNPYPWVPENPTGIYFMNSNTGNDTYKIYISNKDTTGICGIHHKNIFGRYNLFIYNQSGETSLNQYGAINILATVIR